MLHQRALAPAVAVAHDQRATSPGLAAVVVSAAIAAGLDTIELGPVSTPAAKRFLVRHSLGGAVVVTGSHLSPELNGLKLLSGDPLSPVDVRELPAPAAADTRRRGRRYVDRSANRAYVADLAAHADADAIRAASLSASCTGGVGDTARELLSVLGVRDGAELELRLDADGDRLAVNDAPKTRCSCSPPRLGVLDDWSRGRTPGRVLERLLPGRVTVVAPGELHLLRGMAETDAELAGEGNGGVVRAELASGRDGLGAAVLLLELLARERQCHGELLASLPAICVRRATLKLEEAYARARALPEAVDYGPARGVELEPDTDSWVLVRPSATEPVVRVTVEAPGAAAAEALLREVLAELAR